MEQCAVPDRSTDSTFCKAMSAIGKKLHHFVPRFYLRAWAQKEHIYCLQEGTIRRPNLRNVCAENYFYGLQHLSDEDIAFLRKAIIDGSPDALKSSHEQLTRTLMLPYLAKQRLNASGGAASPAMAEAARMIVELNENLHTGMEDRFRPYLSSMLAGDLSFLQDASEAAVFLWCLAIQYARTNHVKRVQHLLDSNRAELYRRLANPLVHIIAANVGCSLFAERERFTVVLLENSSATPFITADQPIINIASKPNNDLILPTRFELYYPLSPIKAMLLLEPASDYLPSSLSVSGSAAHLYNQRLAARAHRQVLATGPTVLEAIRDELPAYLSCFP